MKHKSTLNLLLKNSFRNTVNAWPVTLGLTLLITLLSLIVSLMTSIGDRIVDNYKALRVASNARDGLIQLNNTDLVPNIDGETNPLLNQQQYIYNLEQQYEAEDSKYDFYWSRTEARNFSGVQNMKKGNNLNLTIKIVAKTTPGSSAENVDAVAIGAGRNIKYNADNSSLVDHMHDIVIDSTFAKRNNVKIGDIIRVQEDAYGSQLFVKSDDNEGKLFEANKNEIKKIKDLADPDDIFNKEFSTLNWMQVVGFGESYDYTLPILNDQTTIPNKDTELVSYVNPHVMGLYKQKANDDFVSIDTSKHPNKLQATSNNDAEAYYSFRFKDRTFTPTKEDMQKINSDFLNLVYAGKNNEGKPNQQYVFLDGDKEYQYSSRTTGIQTSIKAYNAIAGIILAIVAIIVIFSVGLISKKQIDKTRSQIGVMKALGYEKRFIVWNYVTMPFISSLVGGILGFVAAQFAQEPLINLFNDYFNLAIGGWSFDVSGFLIDVVVMWFLITAIGFGIAYWVMRTNTLELLSAAKASNISKWGMAIKELNRAKEITPQMESALFASNSGKMFSVTAIVLLATIAMTVAFPLPTVLKANQSKSYTGVKYKQIVQYNDPIYNNPYTFMNTWDPTVKNPKMSYQYNDVLKKVTPLAQLNNGGYDLATIFSQLESGKIDSEYFDLEFQANAVNKSSDALLDKNHMPVAGATNVNHLDSNGKLVKDDSEVNGEPNPMQALIANTKMLQMYGVTLSTDYFKIITDWELKDAFGWNILNNQWPGYLNFTANLRSIAKDTNADVDNDSAFWQRTYLALQDFYKNLVAGIGLSVTRDYYDYDKTPEAYKAYESHNYKEQIDLFNENTAGKNAAFASFKNETSADGFAFGDKLVNSGLSRSEDFKLSDGTGPLDINHIMTNVNNDSSIDHYLTDSPDKMDLEEVKRRVADYLTWYGAYVSERSGTALVLASYTRPPYFVQQYTKKAYESEDDTYRYGFSSVPYNPDVDQLGTDMNAETMVKNKQLDFKIYGIQNNNDYVDLRDEYNNNLVSKLFDTNYAGDKLNPRVPAIVINQSLAEKLNLSAGQDVSFKILYKELQNNEKGTGVKYTLDDWKANPRKNADANNGGWISENDMNTFGITVGGKKFTTDSMNVSNAPSDFYKDFLDNKIINADKSKDQIFKVVGIHKGYGTPTAWVKNSDAEGIMGYSDVRRYLWNNLFVPQFGNAFSPDNKDTNSNNYKMNDTGTILTTDGTLKDWATFNEFLTGDLKFELTGHDLDVAQRIMKIFNNAYPVFNYKYSMNEDIGDIRAGVTTWDLTGGYSPIEENGGIDATNPNKVYNAIGNGAIKGITPVQISKDVLKQLSQVIMAVVVIVIALVIILTFIIIMLTTSLIISDNIRFIATMKVLGYSTGKIVNTVLGMYAIAIVCSYVVGFIAGWFILQASISGMALASSFVLPLTFPWWLLFAVALAVCGIYIITFAVGFVKIQKANPLEALKNMEI